MRICEATDADHDEIWRIFHEVVAAGDTYAFNPDTPREGALAYWFARGTHTYVAKQGSAGERRRRPRRVNRLPLRLFKVETS